MQPLLPRSTLGANSTEPADACVGNPTKTLLWRQPLWQNGKVLTLTEPQVWVLIGVFSTAIFGMMSWQAVWFNRTLTTSVNSFREVMDARFESIDRRFEGIERQLAALDRDVAAISRHVFGTGPRD